MLLLHFKTILKRFGKQGEKTGWTYIDIPSSSAQELLPGNKKGFRVKGKIDQHPVKGMALLPMGNGDFILTVNQTIRKAIKKQKGDEVIVQLELDLSPVLPPPELVECLNDEPEAQKFFNSLSKGHQNYFIKWIESARTEPTKAHRIAATINGLLKKMDFGMVLRSLKTERDQFLK